MNGPDEVTTGVLRLDDSEPGERGAKLEVVLLVAIDVALHLGRGVPFYVLGS